MNATGNLSGFSIAFPEELVDALVERVREALGAQGNVRDLPGTARFFGVADRQVRTWREKGCPARLVGKRLMFDVREVENWLLAQEKV